jgi:CHASE3 domain sensor protein
MIITRIIKNNPNLRLGKKKSNLYSIIFAVPLFLFILFLNSCDTNPVEMKLNDLKTSCDYVHATNIIIQQIITAKSEKNVDKLITEKKILELTEKLNKISAAADKKYTEAEFQECDEWKTLTFNSNKLKEMAEKLQAEVRLKFEEDAKRVADSTAKVFSDEINQMIKKDSLAMVSEIEARMLENNK